MKAEERRMTRQNIIIIITPGSPPEAWGNLHSAAKAHGWVYNTLVKKKIPAEGLEWDGSVIYRVPFRSGKASKNFQERKMMKMILELRDQENLVCYAYIVPEMTGKPVLLGNQIQVN